MRKKEQYVLKDKISMQRFYNNHAVILLEEWLLPDVAHAR
jgi:hypothetical protein